MNLKEKALLVNFSRKAYSARKYDKKVTDEVDQNHGSKNAGRYNKLLIAKEALEAGQKAANAARTFVYAQTLPWTDEGWRILTSANYLPFTQGISPLIAAIEAADREFITRYPDFKEDAKTRLNGLYNETDYPPVEEIERKFSVSIQFAPIPESTDFRIPEGLTQEEIDQMGSDLDSRVTAATEAANKDLWERLFQVTKRAAETLNTPDAIFRDSLIQNIKDLCELLPRLNITADPNLEIMRQEVENRLSGIDPEALRPKNAKTPTEEAARKGYRKQTAEEAKKILETMSSYFTPPVN